MGRGVRLPELMWTRGAVTPRRALRSAGIKSVELLPSLDYRPCCCGFSQVIQLKEEAG